MNMSGKTLTGSEIVMESLLRQGVDTVFGYPGGAVIPLYDVMFKKYVHPKKLRHILVRHEQAAAFAACGVGRVTGKAGVCIATSGPGATNLVTGIADAMMDNSPVVAITGQVFSHLIGTDAFQETDAVGVMMPIVKHSFSVDRAEDIEQALVEAFHLAETGRPGPVHVDITKDAFINTTKYFGNLQPNIPGYKPTKEGSVYQIKKALELIEKAERPIAIIGHGAMLSGANTEVMEFLEKADIPAVSTLHGISTIPTDHPNYISMLGMHGSVTANYATYHSDLIISFGSRFDDRITGKLDDFCPQAKVIHFDIDPAELSKNVHAHVPVVGDIKNILQKMNPQIPKRLSHEPWWGQIQEWQKEFPINRGQKAQDHGKKMRAAEVIQILGEETEGKAYVAPDVGQHQMFTAQYYPFKTFRGHVSSGGLGSMGAGLPLAIGVKIAHPNAEVWSLSGDGGFQMNLPEMATLQQDGINVKMGVLNNNYLGMVRQWQDLYHKKNYASTDLWNPDFVKIAEAYGIPAFRASSAEEAREAIQKAREIEGPTFIEFSIAQEENIFPMVDAGASLKDTRVGD
jgi:acetolactate synthase-1/2/3 large subunit